MDKNKRMPLSLKELINRDKKTQTEHVGVHKATQVDGSLVDGGNAVVGVDKETQTDRKDTKSVFVPKYNRWSCW